MPIKPATKRLVTMRLASCEAPHSPIRQHERAAASAICAARRNGGISIFGTAGDRRQRVSDSRSREEAAKLGLLRGNSLTPKGLQLVRSWTWPFFMDELHEALLRLCDCVSNLH